MTNPDNAGGPVAVGDTIDNCATLTATYTAGATSVGTAACWRFALIAGPAIMLLAPDSTPLGTPTQATAILSGGDPTGSITYRVFAANDSMCTTPLTTQDPVSIDGIGAYPSGGFTAGAPGAYKWVARYNGDVLHAASATGCNDPAGAFAVVAPPTLSAAFGAEEIGVGESTALTFTITNPAANTVPLTGVALENTLPAGLVIASPNGLSGSCGAGTITAGPGSQSVSLVGGTIPSRLELQLLGAGHRLDSGLGDEHHGRRAVGERRRRRSRDGHRHGACGAAYPAGPHAGNATDHRAASPAAAGPAQRAGAGVVLLARGPRTALHDQSRAPPAVPRCSRPGGRRAAGQDPERRPAAERTFGGGTVDRAAGRVI